jgi:hypothetical protein
MDGQDDVVSELTGPGWRLRLRATRVGSWLLKLAVLVVGGVFIALGLVLVVLPGPLTIPPVLFGLWIWSTEFAWAERLRLRAAVRGRAALELARRRPVHSAAATTVGVLLLIAALIALSRYDVVGRVSDAFG